VISGEPADGGPPNGVARLAEVVPPYVGWRVKGVKTPMQVEPSFGAFMFL